MARPDRAHRRLEAAGDGRRMVRPLNIDGDGQGDLGGHGGPHRAVLVYQLDSYRHWRELLGRDDLEHGAVRRELHRRRSSRRRGLHRRPLPIGDALFEVSQPRVTCYRVGIRLGEPGCRRCWSPIVGPGSTCGCCTRARSAAGDPIAAVQRSGADERRRGRRAALPARARPGTRWPSARCGSRTRARAGRDPSAPCWSPAGSHGQRRAHRRRRRPAGRLARASGR